MITQRVLNSLIKYYGGDLISVLDDFKHNYNVSYCVLPDGKLVHLSSNFFPLRYNRQICQECLDLLLDSSDFSVISRSIGNKFRWYGKQYSSNYHEFIFDKNTQAYHKLNDTQVTLYYSRSSNKWCIRNGGELRVKTDYLDIDKFSDLDVGNSYIFELVDSSENSSLPSSVASGLYYVATVSNQTGNEFTYEDGFRYISKYVTNLYTLPHYFVSNANQVLELVSELPIDVIGLVVCNSCHDRLFFSNQRFITYNSVINKSNIGFSDVVRLLDVLQQNELLVLDLLHQHKSIVESVLECKQKLFADIERVYAQYCNIKSNQEFAANVVKYPFSRFLFNLRHGNKSSIQHSWNKTVHYDKTKLLMNYLPCH